MESQSAADEKWLQGLIAAGLKIGISKRELLEDYYPDELALVFSEYARLSMPPEERVEEAFGDDLW